MPSYIYELLKGSFGPNAVAYRKGGEFRILNYLPTYLSHRAVATSVRLG